MFTVKKNILLIGLLMVLFMINNFVLGCSHTTGSHREIIPTTYKLSNYKTILVNVTSDIPDSSLTTTRLGGMIVAELEEKNLFNDIFLVQFTPEAEAELGLDVKITYQRKVPSSVRIWVGKYAGKDGIATIVEVVDLKSNITISKFGAASNSFGFYVIERTAMEIVEYLYNNM